jgi:hypothetical protein
MRRHLYLCALFILAILLSCAAQAALIPPFFINSVVALGGMQSIPQTGQPDRVEWQTTGTGFFYGYLVENNADPTKKMYEIYLVTARHVVQGHLAANRGDLKARINPKESTSPVQEFSIPNKVSDSESAWFYHPDPKIDIAIVRTNLPELNKLGFEPSFFLNDQSLVRTRLAENQVSAGDGIFVLGFPMNLAGVQRNYVIVRQGVIARISEMLEKASNSFLVDSFVFPGNSGGPVVLKPEAFSIQGTKSQSHAALIGLVTSYRPYSDLAVSPQTGRPRVVFEENSGLAEVLPVDYIEETIKAWRSKQGLKDADLTFSTPPNENSR